jgi:methyltransferase
LRISEYLYPTIVIVLFIEALFEVVISKRNSTTLIKKGAIDIAPHLLPWMAFVYGIKFSGSFIEYFVTKPVLPSAWLISFGTLVIAAKVLKFWAISTLGHYWSMKVLILPGSQTVSGGPYRWIRHPNYVAVVTEVIAIPLMGKAFITATIVTILFSILLYLRIKAEEQALIQYTDYSKTMGDKRRFIP